MYCSSLWTSYCYVFRVSSSAKAAPPSAGSSTGVHVLLLLRWGLTHCFYFTLSRFQQRSPRPFITQVRSHPLFFTSSSAASRAGVCSLSLRDRLARLDMPWSGTVKKALAETGGAGLLPILLFLGRKLLCSIDIRQLRISSCQSPKVAWVALAVMGRQLMQLFHQTITGGAIFFPITFLDVLTSSTKRRVDNDNHFASFFAKKWL